jgi:exodeoxyribonuclease V alpha subunit
MHDLAAVLGTLPEVAAGEWIDAQGNWFIDQQYGRQFRAVQIRTSPPGNRLAKGMRVGAGMGCTWVKV